MYIFIGMPVCQYKYSYMVSENVRLDFYTSGSEVSVAFYASALHYPSTVVAGTDSSSPEFDKNCIGSSSSVTTFIQLDWQSTASTKSLLLNAQ